MMCNLQIQWKWRDHKSYENVTKSHNALAIVTLFRFQFCAHEPGFHKTFYFSTEICVCVCVSKKNVENKN